MPEKIYDVAVVGAGIAGLTAAISLQKNGRNVIVLERRRVAGGLCGTANYGGYEFSIGCNDFGSGFSQRMKRLGVFTPFQSRRSIFRIGQRVFTFPPDPKTLMRMSADLPGLARIGRSLKNLSVSDQYPVMEQFLDAHACRTKTADLLALVPYAMGAAPAVMPTSWLRETFSRQYEYGVAKSMVPGGGPARLIDDMVMAFESAGGHLVLGVEVSQIEGVHPERTLNSTAGIFRASRVVTSQPRTGEYQSTGRPGLASGMIHLVVDKSFTYPRNAHTLGYFPARTSSWLNLLNQGEMPNEFGFHAFPSTLRHETDYLGLNVCFLVPRGFESLTKPEEDVMSEFVMQEIERILPGVGSKVLDSLFISPETFTIISDGLSSRPVPIIPNPRVKKPSIYDPVRDLCHVGNSVEPPGEHSGGALLSGLMAAEIIRKGQARGPSDPHPVA
ncbi:phytoene desaturase family protein [Streptomyces sp. NPDC058664]|uniref:phytoene desaturase family protein n=1 Tax=unclassified Streptomyces TaxID=2593676 RepID=UPI00364F7522